MRVWSQPHPRSRVLILPSHPVRHFTVRRKAGRCSTARRAAEGLPLRADHHVGDAEVVQVVLDALLAVAAVGGDGAGPAPVRVMTRCTAGASWGASVGLPCSRVWSTITPSSPLDDLGGDLVTTAQCFLDDAAAHKLRATEYK
jgi:hypothetical protein